jgi:hypothetical protein
MLSNHALIMYMLSAWASRLATRIVPKDSPVYMMPVLLLIGFGGDILILLFLEMNNINVRL